MPTRRFATSDSEHLTVEYWPEGLTSDPVPARVVSLAPGVLCLATAAPPTPGARFVAKFSIRGEFPIVAGCQARWCLQHTATEHWVSATFLTLESRDWKVLSTAWGRHLDPGEAWDTPERALAAVGA
jgi:hypothetical protein